MFDRLVRRLGSSSTEYLLDLSYGAMTLPETKHIDKTNAKATKDLQQCFLGEQFAGIPKVSVSRRQPVAWAPQHRRFRVTDSICLLYDLQP